MIDLRSDTVTKPSEEMRKAMYEGEVGDDVYGEDPTVRKLEERIAENLGKEDALFVPSGTQSNQIAVLTATSPSQEVILEASSHLFYYEGGAMSALANVQPRTLVGKRGVLDLEEVERAIRPDDIHFPKTGLICIENTHNKSGGSLVPLENMKQTYELAQRHNIPVHLDGARLFNAAVSANLEAKTFAQYADSISICFSKGLGAPVGSALVGDKSFIDEARVWRKRLGGGMRQAGVLAAAALIALEENTSRLVDDHKHAKMLADGLRNISNITIDNEVDTNMVIASVQDENMTSNELLSLLKERDVLGVPVSPEAIRLTTHLHIQENDIKQTIQAFEDIFT
ncbi:low-specificity L-threonine aldolase [Texcoconibacillus texcoconensis]|uniref:Threonine aldolase n=1 Tax=Texcoconibacillus texcoconensis TaxID=1095777 RepID=A0A840QN63_9BACI|nr:low-specificity L-threonine aldolase [Texcoconibacillus texcoconensis]MBB5172814.1 threonine aldolase [Texcoconibacillus texcoconensis]